MKKIPKSYLIIGIMIILVVGVLVFTVRHYDNELEKVTNQNEKYKDQVKQLKKDNKEQQEIIARQDKDVVTKEEEGIRD
ncbi:TPA: hypothetical protein O4697_002813, partial [Staphylococcus aureus]|nr:hypothetical protein [Staphylococcus aureus]